jgi:hypothetical protein
MLALKHDRRVKLKKLPGFHAGRSALRLCCLSIHRQTGQAFGMFGPQTQELARHDSPFLNLCSTLAACNPHALTLPTRTCTELSRIVHVTFGQAAWPLDLPSRNGMRPSLARHRNFQHRLQKASA